MQKRVALVTQRLARRLVDKVYAATCRAHYVLISIRIDGRDLIGKPNFYVHTGFGASIP
jgi:hypothetical protein